MRIGPEVEDIKKPIPLPNILPNNAKNASPTTKSVQKWKKSWNPKSSGKVTEYYVWSPPVPCAAKSVWRKEKKSWNAFKKNKNQIINDNSDIFSSCKCGSRFHKFARILDTETTLRTRPTQKKSTSRRKTVSRQKMSKRSSLDSTSTTETPISQPSICIPCPSPAGSTSTYSSEESASPSSVTPVFSFDTNVPGLPYRSPTANPTNLERAQVQHFLENHFFYV